MGAWTNVTLDRLALHSPVILKVNICLTSTDLGECSSGCSCEQKVFPLENKVRRGLNKMTWPVLSAKNNAWLYKWLQCGKFHYSLQFDHSRLTNAPHHFTMLPACWSEEVLNSVEWCWWSECCVFGRPWGGARCSLLEGKRLERERFEKEIRSPPEKAAAPEWRPGGKDPARHQQKEAAASKCQRIYIGTYAQCVCARGGWCSCFLWNLS